MAIPRPKGDLFYFTLSIPVGIFGGLTAIYATVLAIQAGSPLGEYQDVAIALAAFGSLILCVLSTLMLCLWYAIYARKTNAVIGSLVWIGIFSAILIGVNFTILKGVVNFNVLYQVDDSDLPQAFLGPVRYTFSKPFAWLLLLLLWPLVPIAWVETYWRNARKVSL